ncbi:hypothetical protein GCM10010231_35330 [Streptomyces sindenensis]|nr:hypothetical protein GCM10010231_35330 [Streptomyces sindenensis]
MTSIRSFSWPDAVTSRPVTEPPEDSTAVVSWETAVPLAGTSSLTVIEYETLGAVAMAESFAFLSFIAAHPEGGFQMCLPIVAPTDW